MPNIPNTQYKRGITGEQDMGFDVLPGLLPMGAVWPPPRWVPYFYNEPTTSLTTKSVLPGLNHNPNPTTSTQLNSTRLPFSTRQCRGATQTRHETQNI